MNKYKSFLYRFISTIFIFIFLFPNLSVVNAKTALPELNSEGVALLDGDTGEVLYEKNGEKQFFPASTTKVLTALIVLENSKLSDIVTIGKNPPFADGSSIGLKEGEKYSVEDLLLGLMLESGNDCAEALAEHVSGSIDNFVKLMNKRAKELGCKNSNFKNPSGLPDEEHLTTPIDLALIMREANKNKTFVEISRTTSKKLPPSNLDGYERYVNNHNYILLENSKYYYPYSVASKKGYTVAANFTNVISARKDNLNLVASFLNGEGINEVYDDVAKIFNYGFDSFSKVKLYSEGDNVGSFKIDSETSIPLIASKDISTIVDIDEKNNITPILEYKIPVGFEKKSIKIGDIIASSKIIVNNKEIDTMDLVSGKDREYNSQIAFNKFWNKNKSTIILIVSFTLLFIIYIRILILRKKRRRQHEARMRKLTNGRYKGRYK